MPDITLEFPVRATAAHVFARFATPVGLDAWWTLSSEGEASLGAAWRLDFGPGYAWQARVTACEAPRLFELEITDSMDDWRGTRVRAELEERDGVTTVHFRHAGWLEASEHFRVSTFCWAMYLRHMRRHVEVGVLVPYAERLDA